MKTYSKYRDSGIDWINEIPGYWEVKKIKHRCYVKARVGWKGLKSDEFLTSGYAYLVTGQDFKNDAVIWSECYHIAKERYEEDPYIQLKNNDLLITKDGTIGKLAIVRGLNKPACLNSGIFVVRSTKDDFTTDFLLWVLKSRSFKQFNEYTSYGSTIQHLYQNVFVEFSFPFPPLKEQTAIANYLDRKTAEIDELIADKKRLLELYEEEKTAIINELVTGKKVWDGNAWNEPAKVKDSGIEWLGEIPEHWEVKRLKYIASINDEVLTEKTEDEYEIEYVEISGVKSGLGIVETSNLRFKDAPSRARRIVRDGDVLVSTVRTYLKSIAKVDSPPDNLIASTGFAVIRPRNMDSDYAGFLFYSEPLIGEIISVSTGVSYPAINSSQIGDIKIPLPPLDEQKYIAVYIYSKIASLNIQKSRTVKLIELLSEYRTALISEVVTGKIKVVE
jgi:type I restriction enzyme, S subunit